MSRTCVLGALLTLFVLCPAAGWAGEGGQATEVALWAVIPFVVLLLSIAVAPFINRHWWERYYPAVSFALGSLSVVYYLFVLHAPGRLLHTLVEYASFICLIGSLFVVAGGIVIRLRGKSTPHANVALLGIGAVISNLIGTTGASMILIRPYLRVNKYRVRPYHVVFFIFIVSNMGGALTPIGDPPLFLGFLRGIPFFWVFERLWLPWLIAVGCVLGIFAVIDWRSFRKLRPATRHEAVEEGEEGEVTGLHNIVFLCVILIAVFITNPPFVREGLMILAAAASYATTSREIHRKNHFNFLPIKEVAVLFAGIFATMIPALDWLEANAVQLGVRTPGEFYWRTGALSSVLDNAPTYLNFLSAAIGLLVPHGSVELITALVREHGAGFLAMTAGHSPDIRAASETLLRYHYDVVAAGSAPAEAVRISYLLGVHPIYVEAISLGAVFFGAATYIGNGPNFMVKSIAEQSHVDCPSFFGYVVQYTLPVLLPVFVLIWFLFFL